MERLIVKLRKALYEHSPDWEQANTIMEEMTALSKKRTPERLEMHKLTHELRNLKGSLQRNASMLATDEVLKEFLNQEEAQQIDICINTHSCEGPVLVTVDGVGFTTFDTETGDIHEVIRKAIIKSMQIKTKVAN